MKRFLIYVFCFCVIGIAFGADAEYEDYVKKTVEKYEENRTKSVEQYLDFASSTWEKFNARQEVKRSYEPKPVKMPAAEIPALETNMENSTSNFLKIDEEIIMENQMIKGFSETVSGNTVFDFYGTPIGINLEMGLPSIKETRISEEVVERTWNEFNDRNMGSLVGQFMGIKEKLHLNDWGYLRLIYAFSKQVKPREHATQKFITWYLYLQSGYEAKIAYAGNDLFILVPFENTLYNTRYLNIDGRKYYNISFKDADFPGSVYTYKTGNPYGKGSSLAVTRLPLLKNDMQSKEVTFLYHDNTYNMKVYYDKNIVDYYSDYPQTDLQIYGNAPAGLTAIIAGLKKLTAGKDELESVEIILSFCQHSFEYKTDGEQFGKEKVFFPEETVYYPFSDCEDRTIIFHYLVRELTGLETVFVKYPTHLAAGVHFNEEVPGDYIHYGNKDFVICDPTYVNAKAGMSMPQLQKEKIEVVELKGE